MLGVAVHGEHGLAVRGVAVQQITGCLAQQVGGGLGRHGLPARLQRNDDVPDEAAFVGGVVTLPQLRDQVGGGAHREAGRGFDGQQPVGQ